jgi:hypothetical protein
MILREIGTDSDNVGIDIAGGTNGRALQQLLEHGILGKALVTNYTDTRTDETKDVEGLDHRGGDLFDRTTWEEIDGWIDENAPDGLSLVMHRPAGTLQDLPAPFYAGAFRFLLERTRPGGLHFLQIPEPLVIPSPERSLKPVYEEVEDSVEVIFSNVDPNSDFPVIPAHVLLRKN